MSIEYQMDDPEGCRQALAATLTAFEQLWPVYERFGFDRATALLDFRMTGVIEAVYELMDELDDDEPLDGDEWKRGLDP